MTSLDRRQFLKRSVIATVGTGSALEALAAKGSFAAPDGPQPGWASPAAKEPQTGNLIANGDFARGELGSLPEGWSLVAKNPALKPSVKLVAESEGGRALMAEGNGRQECFGYLRCPVRLSGGKTYRLRVRFRVNGFEDIDHHLIHGVFSKSFNDGVFRYKREGGVFVGEGHFTGPPTDVEGEVRLYFRYSARGKVWWKEASLEECAPIKPRPVKIAVSWGKGDLAYWERWLDTVGNRGADVALLPEMFNGIDDPMHAESEDGPSWALLARKARQWNMHVSGTVYIRRGDLVFNSAPLFDRNGKLLGAYDKNMLYDPEVDNGATCGKGFPVFQTDVGKIGIIICYDSWFPETVKALALNGAELVLFPNAGYYMQLMHARSADNGVFVAVSSENTPAGVWDSGGNQAGEEKPDPTRYAPNAILNFQKDEAARYLLVTVDLSKKPSPHYWGGPMLSAPGGRRCRRTWVEPFDAEIARQEHTWAEA